MAAAKNSATYADGAPEVTPIMPWPDPVGGFRLRHYDLSKIASPDPSPLKMRLFRSTNLMINIFVLDEAARRAQAQPAFPRGLRADVTRAYGKFVHHLRYPWLPDKTRWRNDEHEHIMTVPRCSSFRRG